MDHKVLRKITYIIMKTLSYYALGFNFILAILFKNTLFNLELAYTFIWYKSVGILSISKSKFLYSDFFQIRKPFHFLSVAYYFPTQINQKAINFISIFPFLIYALTNGDYVIGIFVISPLFSIYFLAESKPERVFFALLWLCLLFNDTLLSYFIFPFTLFSVTTLVTNFGYFPIFVDTSYSLYWFLSCLLFMLYSLLRGQNISNLRWVLKIIQDPTLKDQASFLSRLKHNVSKAQLVTLGVLIFVFLKEYEAFVLASICIIAMNNTVVRFMDSSTERRIFMTVLLAYYVSSQDWQIFVIGLLLPFNLFSSIPEKNFDEAKMRNMHSLLNLLSTYRDRFKLNSMTLVEPTGDYEMNNKARYLWYLYEHAYLLKTDVFPHVYLNEIRQTPDWMTYISLKEDVEYHNKVQFIQKFDYAISYTPSFARLLSNQNFQPIGVLNHSCLNDFGLEEVTIWKQVDV